MVLSLNLQQFGEEATGTGITVRIQRNALEIRVLYVVTGNLQGLRLPAPADNPGYRDHLWQHTCFELFLARLNRPEYVEMNFSPSGHQALFLFPDYRGARKAEMAPPAEPGHLLRGPASLSFSVTLAAQPLEDLLGGPIDLAGPAAVLFASNGRTGYWASGHGAKPDFHDRHYWQSCPLDEQEQAR